MKLDAPTRAGAFDSSQPIEAKEQANAEEQSLSQGAEAQFQQADPLVNCSLAAYQARLLTRAYQGETTATATAKAFEASLKAIKDILARLSTEPVSEAKLASLRSERQKLAGIDAQLRQLFTGIGQTDTQPGQATPLAAFWQQPDLADHYETRWSALSKHLNEIEHLIIAWQRAADETERAEYTLALQAAAGAGLTFLEETALQIESQDQPPERVGVPPIRPPGPLVGAPSLEPSLFPAYITQASVSGPEDLAETPEIQITPEIIELAASLDHSPIKIYEYVRNNFDFDPYYGSLKGSTATLWTDSGNDYDLASLLLALLRASDIPSRYVVGVVTIPIQEAQDWLGVTDAQAALTYLQMATIPCTLITLGDGSTALQTEHVWVEAYVPYSNYGGAAVDASGQTWVPLDPSFKVHHYQPGINLPDDLDFDRDEFLASTNPFLAHEVYQNQVRDYLWANLPGKTLSDVPYQGEIVAEELSLLPASLPYYVDAVNGEYSELPDNLRHKVTVAIDDYSTGQTLMATTTLALPQVSLNRITISYAPDGADLRPVLKVEGKPIATGDLISLGSRVTIRVGFVHPKYGAIYEIADRQKAGEHHALAIDDHQIGDRFIAERAAKLMAANALVGTPEEDPDDLLGELLYLTGMRYFQRIDGAVDVIEGLYHYASTKYLYYALLTANVDVAYLFDRPFAVTPDGTMTLDFGLRARYSFFGIDGDDSQSPELERLEGLSMSALEHQIWEEMVIQDSISTIKGLQFASEQGIPIYDIDSSNLDEILPLLNLSESAENHIVEDVNDGWRVRVHQDEITYNQWLGAAWISENPETGNAGYYILGSLQGGQTTCPDCPVSEDPGTEGEPLDPCASSGQPVTYSNGNMFHQFDDILIPTRGPALQLTRTYNAQSADDGPFGYGWTHNYSMQVTEDGATGDVTLYNESGGQYLFFDSGDGTYIHPIGLFMTLTKVGGNFQLRDKFGTLWTFNSAGRLASITDRNGNAQTLAYDGDGRLSTATDALGRSLSFAYDASDRITSVSNFTGRTWSYVYDGNGNLASSTTPSDANTPAYTTHYDYYTEAPWEHNLKTITDPRGYEISFVYYANDKAFQTIEPEGKVTTYHYLPFRNETTVVNERGSVWTFRYDDQGFIERIGRPDGNVILRSWDEAGNLVEFTDAFGYTTAMNYDDRGNLLTITDPLDYQITYEYDSNFSQLTRITDARGNSTTFSVDPTNGNRLTRTDPLGNVTTYGYDAFGNLTSLTDAKDHTTTFTYDANDYLSQIQDGRDHIWPRTYDALGRLTASSNPLGDTTTYTYDALNRLLAVTDGEDHTQTYEYDGNDNLTRWVDANGRATSYMYDGLNNLTSVTDALGHTAHFSYEYHPCPSCSGSSSNLTSLTDANGHTRRYEYDAFDRLIRETDALGLSKSYTHDAQGNVVQFENEDGDVTRYTYDKLGRLVQTQFPDGTQETFAYDANGNLLTASNDHTTVTFSYDERNQVTQIHDSALGKAIRYTYDDVGNRATLRDADGETWQYIYDENDNLDSLTDFNGVVAIFSYDAADRLTQIAPQAGHAGVRSVFEYDQANRLTDLTNTSPDEAVTFIDFDYTYDNMVNLTNVTASGLSDFDPLIGQTTYDYDNLYQLTRVTLPDGTSQRYEYDANSNRTLLAVSGSESARSFYDETDRLTYGGAEGNARFTYDSRGNLKTKTVDGQTTTYHWDYQNQLTRIDYPDGSHSSYTYDALGRRIRKTLPDGTTIRYLYDGLNMLQEFDAGGSTKAKYVHTLGLDHPLSITRDGQSYYYMYDRLGSVIGLTDGANTLLASYVYDPWGNIIGGNDGGTENPFRYTAREHDIESGLYYYRARYYEPQVSRFVSHDPIGTASGLNLYTYVLNSPTNYIDPSGLLNVNSTPGQGGLHLPGGGIIQLPDGTGGTAATSPPFKPPSDPCDGLEGPDLIKCEASKQRDDPDFLDENPPNDADDPPDLDEHLPNDEENPLDPYGFKEGHTREERIEIRGCAIS